VRSAPAAPCAPPAEFKRSINETEAEARGTAERLQQLQAEREHLQQQQAAAAEAWQQLQQQQEQLRGDAAATAAARWVS
jgi:chromosome segregation ATPase